MGISRREFLKGSGAAAAALSLAAWLDPAEAVEMTPQRPLPQLRWHDLSSMPTAIPSPEYLVLSRLTFGPTTSELDRVRQMGIPAFIEEQLAPEAINDNALDSMLGTFKTLNMNASQLFTGYPQPTTIIQELISATLLRAALGKRQLLEMMVDFWTDHFNIYILKNTCRWLKTVDDREVIRKYALGNFHDLLMASAKSPAMLEYLDNASSTKDIPNENYARELMELHTLSVDGPYTQTDVQEVARCLTGWTVDRRDITKGLFLYDTRRHDQGQKRVLGTTIPANGGMHDGEILLDLLANHPSTAQFIATKLVRRFVADTPPATLVQQVATTFTNTKGDIKSMLRTIFNAPEFLTSWGLKLKRPFELTISSVRITDAVITDGRVMAQRLQAMGQLPFYWPSPNGYPDAASAWINTGGLLNRWNYSLSLAEGTLPGVKADLLGTLWKVSNTWTGEQLVDFWTQRLLGRSVDAGERNQFINYATDNRPGTTILDKGTVQRKTPELVGLILDSPYFQYR
ncbi:MAG: DUF1800 domain-containing protein [Chloroflexi bacterium]|nr:DUF1800 domain-containing protein [Chloroflexota bacterium]